MADNVYVPPLTADQANAIMGAKRQPVDMSTLPQFSDDLPVGTVCRFNNSLALERLSDSKCGAKRWQMIQPEDLHVPEWVPENKDAG